MKSLPRSTRLKPLIQLGDRRDRDLVQEEPEGSRVAADLVPELELEDDVVRIAVLVVVDPEPIGDVRIEVVVVRAGARLLARIRVHDEDDVALVPRLVAAEHEEVRDVGRGIEGDERRFAMTRGQRGSRPRPASDREHESARAGYEQREDRQLSSHGASPL
jgi:hypothetical protein